MGKVIETVGDLVARLQQLPQDALVSARCDGLGQEFAIESVIDEDGIVAIIEISEV